MWVYVNSDELYHYGILGMKWGHRRSRTSSDYKEYKGLRRKKLKELSNNELRKLNDRNNLERQYKLNNPNMIKKTLIAATALAGTLGTIVSIQKNGKNLINSGKRVLNKSKIAKESIANIKKGIDIGKDKISALNDMINEARKKGYY